MNSYLEYFSATLLTISMPLILAARRSRAAATRIDFVDINQFPTFDDVSSIDSIKKVFFYLLRDSAHIEMFQTKDI
jgi:hypothetical protein